MNEDGYRSVSCFGTSINSLLSNLHIFDVDILFIDAEGADSSIVTSLDFERFRIKNLFFENLHLPEGREAEDAEVYSYLHEQGMQVKKKVLTNGWMSHAWI